MWDAMPIFEVMVRGSETKFQVGEKYQVIILNFTPT